MAIAFYIFLATFVSGIAVLINPIRLRAEVLGFVRPQSSLGNIHGEGLKIISNTVQCEDLHHHLPSGLLFAGCQGHAAERYFWFPPGKPEFRDHKAAAKSQGGIFVIDPKTFTSERLVLDGFSGPFITHGIDLYSSPNDPDTVYIFAINHLPNPDYYDTSPPVKSAPKARSQIEIFEHTIGTSTAKFLRSVRDPLIRTPNDLYATSSTSFYVTNDHHYREGLMRVIEEVGWQSVAAWSDIVHVSLGSLSATSDPTADVNATVAISKLHNPNGFGHGSNESDILIVQAAGGVLLRAKTFDPDPAGKMLEIVEGIQLPSTLDNPTYYHDAYASAPGAHDDASGYVLAGLARAHELAANGEDPAALDPVMVWLVQATKGLAAREKKWDHKLVFQDDGKTIRSASAAVLIGIDPKENEGKKQAWLFVTGFLSDAMVASKIDL